MPKILDRLGTPQAIAAMCAHRGIHAPAVSTVRMWRHRQSMPGDWVATALLLLDDGVDLRQFIDVPQPDPFA